MILFFFFLKIFHLLIFNNRIFAFVKEKVSKFRSIRNGYDVAKTTTG